MLKINLNLCVYCERTPKELVIDHIATDLETALQWFELNQSLLHLCEECYTKFVPSNSDYSVIYSEPFFLNPGIRNINHTCPELEFKGKSEKEATIMLELELSSHKNYRFAKCPHCDVEVRSLISEAEKENLKSPE